MIDIDSQRTGGLLELDFPDGSKIVVNTAAAAARALAGGAHRAATTSGTTAARWVDTATGGEFFAVLSREVRARKPARPLRSQPG